MAIFTESYCRYILEGKSSYSFHGINLNCSDAENPERLFLLQINIIRKLRGKQQSLFGKI